MRQHRLMDVSEDQLGALTLGQLKRLAKLDNAHSSWQQIGKEFINELRDLLRKRRQSIEKVKALVLGSKERCEAELGSALASFPKKVAVKLEPHLETMFGSCVHFVPNGSGVVVDKENGLILTCAHCVDHDDDEDEEIHGDASPSRIGRVKTFVTIDGIVRTARCVRFCEENDVALLKIENENHPLKFGSSVGRELTEEPVLLIHNPHHRMYFPFYASPGAIEAVLDTDSRYYVPGLGRMIHSCWTFWGSSGGPLFNSEGHVVGLHNSWNEKNLNRHGVPLHDLQQFLSTM